MTSAPSMSPRSLLQTGTTRLCALVLAWLLAAPTYGASPGPGAEAFAAGDYKRAMSILEPQARRGQAEAQFLLGRMRAEGLGLEVDRMRARFWFNQAAAQGHRGARAALAGLDSGTPSLDISARTTPPASVAANPNPTTAPALPPPPAKPVPRSDAQHLQAMLAGTMPAVRAGAVRLAESVAASATGGDPVLAVLLGEYFESTLGGAADFAAAALWYGKAALSDHPIALNNLGAMYYDGRGVLQSYAEAQRLYQRAAEGGDRVAQFNLALMLGQGRVGAVDLPGMNDWLRKSAAQNYARAQAQLARFHREGIGGPQDLREAVRYFRLAAEQGLPNAQYWLGHMTTRGEGVRRDLEVGAQWIIKAAAAGVAPALFEAAKIYELGLGQISDHPRAVALYRQAGEAGIKAAAERMAAAYTNGELDLKPDAAEATRWAARAGQ